MVVEVVHDILDSSVADFVGFAVNAAAFDTAAGQPHAESVRVVVAADVSAGALPVSRRTLRSPLAGRFRLRPRAHSRTSWHRAPVEGNVVA